MTIPMDFDETGAVHPGQYRLARIQVVNWGTLNGHHDIPVPRRGLLITGPSGSGKSTLIDAISAVLMPIGEARFNAAAQESSKQSGRSLVTYVRGAWRRQADEDSDALTSDYLRPGATWSAIALTYDDAAEQGGGRGRATLVKLMHLGRGKSANAEVKQVHLLIDGDIALPVFEPLTVRGIDTRILRKQFPDAAVHPSYAPFARAFRTRLGITSDSAQRLLHRTLSAKSLSSLDQLFREYMLDTPRTFAVRDTAVEQFRNLREAHRTVVDARLQIQTLEPLEQAAAQRSAATTARDAYVEETVHLDAMRDRTRLALLEAHHRSVTAQIQLAAAAAAQAVSEAESAQERILTLHTRLQGFGDNRVAALRAMIPAAQKERDRIAERRSTVHEALAVWSAAAPADSDSHAHLTAQIDEELHAMAADRTALRERIYTVQNSKSETANKRRALVADRETLARRRSNLDPVLLRTRETLSAATGIAEDRLPFAGELIAVRAEEADWTGPIERVLGPLARTMLVDDQDYPAVAAAVDATDLGARLVYRRVRTDARHETLPTTAPESLVRKIDTRTGPFTAWLTARLSRRYDYACVAGAAELAHVDRGVTRAGQVRSDHERHEKDDRFPVDDRRRWVLGFDNEAKLADLRARIDRLDTELANLEHRGAGLDAEEVAMRRRETAARTVLDCPWPDIDVDGAQASLDGLRAELAELTGADTGYAVLEAELAQAREAGREADTARSAAQATLTTARRDRDDTAAQIDRLQSTVRAHPPVPEDVGARIEGRFSAGTRRVTKDNLDELFTAVVRAVDRDLRAAEQQITAAEKIIVDALHRYLADWPERAADLRAEAAFVDDALAILTDLRTEGLPAYEAEFFEMLSTQAHRNFGDLARLIQNAPGEIRARIEPVNESLSRSAFDTDRTLRIDVKDRRPAVVSKFLAQLREIMAGTFAEQDRATAEARFTAMAEVFAQLDSTEPADRRWQRQVLDTRLHVGFIGVEIDPEGAEANHHDSSAGLSGGQAQKLVFFCLAAALRYQLADRGAELPRYATVVLDEAFDRADPAYTRRALGVFEQFGFHLVLATPLKLLQTLDDHIGGVVTVGIRDRKETALSYLALGDEAAAADPGAGTATPPATDMVNGDAARADAPERSA